MYYPESAIIASENSHLTEVIRRVDQFLFERQGQPFYAGTAADVLRIKIPDLEGVLNLYQEKNVVRKRRVWLCPQDRQEIEFISDDTLRCELCGVDYPENECVLSELYSANQVEDEIEKADSSTSLVSLPTTVISSSKYSHQETLVVSPQGDVLVAQATINAAKIAGIFAVIAAIIGVIGAIITAIISNSNTNSAIQATQMPPFIETLTPIPTPSSTPNVSLETPTANAINLTLPQFGGQKQCPLD